VGTSYPGIVTINGAIQTALDGSPYRLEFYSEYMDTGLFPDPTDQQKFRDYYLQKYQNRKPDVIITVGPSPLKFMREVHKTAFPGVPIVFCLPALGAPASPELDSDFTGVQNDLNPVKTLEIALRLRPGTEHVVVVSGGIAEYDKQELRSVEQQLRGFAEHLDVTYITELAMPDLLERLRHLPDHSLVLLTTVSLDAAGTRFTSRETGPMIAAAANAPVFSLFDVYINHGEVGGYLSSLSGQGKVAGDMALRILKGDKPQDVTRVAGVNTYMFDWRALKRWGLKESDLPPHSVVLNHQRTVWESYKSYIVVGTSLIVGESLLIFALVWQRARRKAVEEQLATTFESVRESERRFQLVANTTPVMIWMSGADKLYNYVNQTWLDFTGRSLEAELGNGWLQGVHPDDLKDCLGTYTQAFDLRESFKIEYRARRHNGEYRWVLDIGVPRLSLDGTFAGFIGSCVDITDRKLAEEALADVGRKLIQAHEEERTWIARELHDDINQRVALLSTDLKQWAQYPPSSEVGVRNDIGRVLQGLADLATDIQALSHRLHSSKLEYLGLAAAAKGFCRELSEQKNIEIDFIHEGIPRNLPKEISLCLFRVLQEALQNAVKHSGEREFRVELRATSEEIRLAVNDQGVGFDQYDAVNRHGLGLVSMQERTHLVGGELSIRSEPSRGVTISARIPLEVRKQRASAAGSDGG